ncbi:hypothetical protein MC885_001254 [Smutsia gigantea]|nr:hypothetical protein MC885_001254 [Smutsia gigantea]
MPANSRDTQGPQNKDKASLTPHRDKLTGKSGQQGPKPVSQEHPRQENEVSARERVGTAAPSGARGQVALEGLTLSLGKRTCVSSRWLLLCHALCFSLLKASAHTVKLNDMFGQIQSPGYPDSYPSDSEVTWNITVPEGFRIKLYFMHFNLESSYLCEYDYVKVETEDQVLATFCGRETTDTEQTPGQEVVLSPGSFMSITFRSDFSNEERFTGFDAHYMAVDVDECTEREDEELSCDHYCHNYIGGFYCSCRFGYILHTDNRTCREDRPDFPNPYPKSSECFYVIELEEGFMVSLQFEDIFDIEDHPEVPCPYDFIKIKAGPNVLGPFCGERAPGPINTQSHSVQILFRSDNSGENRGWRLSYRATGNECPDLQPPVHGKIEPVQAKYSFKDQVLISCDMGYRVLKDKAETVTSQIECLKDGTWSDKIPACQSFMVGQKRLRGLHKRNGNQGKGCGGEETGVCVNLSTRPELEHGLVTFSTRNNLTTYKSEIRYSCQQPYYKMLHNITGIYSCSAQGVWMNEVLGRSQPTCLPVCGQPSRSLPNLVKRIIGGRNAEPGLFPWQALIVVEDTSRVPNDKWFGSGALLSESWILTAAHVLRSQRRDNTVTPVSKEHVTVYLGLHDCVGSPGSPGS